jgi:hypothetical protein
MVSFVASRPRGFAAEAASALMLKRCAWHNGLKLEMRALRRAERTSIGLIIDALFKSQLAVKKAREADKGSKRQRFYDESAII